MNVDEIFTTPKRTTVKRHDYTRGEGKSLRSFLGVKASMRAGRFTLIGWLSINY